MSAPRKAVGIARGMDGAADRAPDRAEAGLLSALQRNSLRITLRLADEAFQDVMRLLEEAPYEGALHGMADDLTPDQKAAIAEEVRQAGEIIRRLRARFALDPEVHDKSRLILGKVITAWEMVMEGRARYLRGYGPVAPGLAEALDPSIERLGDALTRIETLARTGRNRSQPGREGEA